MALKHALLALLVDEPGYGYELNKRFEEALGSLWALREAQIYNNLRILEQGGLVVLEERVEQENLPDRKQYALTEAGRVELQEWLSSPIRSSRQLKDDFYLKLSVLAGVLRQPVLVSDLLWKQREVALQQLRELEQVLQEAEVNGETVTAALVEGAILHAEADLTWLDRCEERLLQGGAL
jgi:PadR family transcriptional regulator, regulatory protein AphA